MKYFEPGEQIETKIVAISGDTIFLDLGLKSEGILDRAELADENGVLSVKEGDTIKAFYLSSNGDELHFTTRLGRNKTGKGSQDAAILLESAFRNEIPVEGHVEKEIKGGYEIMIGTVRAFCPYSQMGYKQKEDAGSYVGKHLTFHIQEYKNDGRNIVVSNRAIGEAAEKEHLQKVQQTIIEGITVKGTIKSLQKYGAFVEIDGFEALLPVSEIKHGRVDTIESVLSVGQQIEAKVIKTDWIHNRVSISMKALEADPWDSVSKKFTVGTKLPGTISHIAEFGIFVTLEEGIDGLVHISTLENIDANTNLRKVFKVGATMNVAIEKIDSINKRISLRPASSLEQDETAKKYLADQENQDTETYNPFAALLKK